MKKCKVCGKELVRQKIVCSRACRNKLYTNKGIKFTQEHKDKIAAARREIGSPWNVERNKKYKVIGAAHTNWKGDNVGYIAIHNWAHRHVGLKPACENCGSKDRLEMSNKSGQYHRTLNDWQTLCKKCHAKFDAGFRKNGGVTRKLHRWTKQNSPD